MYVDVCIKHRLECSNALLEKNKAVVYNWLKDFCDVFFGTCMLLAQIKVLHFGLYLAPIILVHRVCIFH